MKRTLIIASAIGLFVATGASAQSRYDAAHNRYIYWPGFDRVDASGIQSPQRIGASTSVRLGSRIGTDLSVSLGDQPNQPQAGPTIVGMPPSTTASPPSFTDPAN